MYLHLGQNVVVRTSTVIGIFDIENTSLGKITRQYLAKAQKAERVINVSADLPKSFIVCQEKQGVFVYLSQISPATLRKRTSFLEGLSNL